MAMSILAQDINHAGYYGEFYSLPAAGAALPDPCLMTPAALYSALAFPVQGYDAPLLSPLSCLSDANFMPGTDTNWAVTATAADPLTSATATVTQGVRIRLPANFCP